MKQITALRPPVVYQKDPINSDTRGAQFSHRAGFAFADLGDAIAPAQVEVNVPVSAQESDSQWGWITLVHVDPVKGNLLQLFVGSVFIRSPHDKFLGAEVFGCFDYGV